MTPAAPGGPPRARSPLENRRASHPPRPRGAAGLLWSQPVENVRATAMSRGRSLRGEPTRTTGRTHRHADTPRRASAVGLSRQVSNGGKGLAMASRAAARNNVQVYGPDDGPVLVFAHGFGTD